MILFGVELTGITFNVDKVQEHNFMPTKFWKTA